MGERTTIADLERRLTDSETRHRLLIHSWAQAEWETDAEGVVVADSPSWRAYTGQTIEQWLGYGWLDAIHPDDRAYAERQWRDAMTARSLVNAEFRLRAPDGGWRWTNVRAAPVLDASGDIAKWVGMNIDIDDRKRAEATLRESESRLRTLFDSIDEGYAELDVILGEHGEVVDWRYVALNAAFTRLTGMDDVTGRLISEIVPDLEPEWREIYTRVLKTGEPIRFEQAAVSLDQWYEVYAARSGGPESRRIVVVYSNITERKRAEVALRASEERQAFLLLLSDTLRPIADPVEIQRVAASLLGKQLQASRVFYVNVGEDGETADILGDYADGVGSRVGRYALSGFSTYALAEWRAGRNASSSDVDTDPRYSEAERRAYASVSTRAGFGIPLIKEGRLKAILGVNQSNPRHWTDEDVGLAGEVAERTWAALEQARAEAALRESDERQAFLLALSDDLRPLEEPRAIQTMAMKHLAERLRVERAGYYDLAADQDHFALTAKWERDGAPPLERFQLTDFGPDVGDGYRAGRTMVMRDASRDAGSDETRATYRSIGVCARVGVPLVKGGRLLTVVALHSATPRDWTPAEIELVESVAERTWASVERARAEAALRDSEARFQQFANASAAGMWIRDAETLQMEYASPAIARVYGVEPDTLLGDIKQWAKLILPEDREVVLAQIERARQGEAAIHEFRIQRSDDQSFRWIRNTDFPLRDDQGRIQRIGGLAEDVTEAKLAVEHQGVLLAELQHRVRNIMALIRSITARTGERATSVQDYAGLMLGRLSAFARVQALLTRAANASVGMASIIRDEVSVQAQHDGQYVLNGPDIELSPKAAEVLTLAVHELATNAVKYGALSAANGKVTATWSTFDKRGGAWVAFDWIEEGAPQPPESAAGASRRQGFGSELIEGRVPYELKGKGTISIEPGGARCRLEFPLKAGASILETGAPQRATVFGGSLDMTGEADLGGRRVLVVEDDYYLATDAARALQGAGAEVMGPCGSEEDARAELDGQRPDAVLLDINLGKGATFKLAEYLKDSGIPFVFTTGYDQDVIPAEFDGIERLEKPFQLREIVGAAARLVGQAA